MTPLEQLADWASRLAPADIPADQHQRVRMRLMDTIGLIAAASGHPAGRSLAAWTAANPGTGATILPTGAQASPAVAALVHGSLAHARDFDDTFPDTVVHPGSTVIAAALAAGEASGASFDELSTAIVAGYEIAARLGAAAGRAFHARGFHATSIVGPVAAAGAAGRLLNLDRDMMADAMGLATSMSGGLFAFLADGAWSKWMHTGWSAHGGLIAAQLASHAFRGPRHALDHKFGLYGAFLGAGQADLGVITRELGQTWLGATAQAKIFPCAHVIQPYIEQVLRLRASGCLDAGTVQSIHCVMAPWAMPIVGEPRETKIAPRNDLDAIASLPFMVAAALCDGGVDLSTLHPETIGRADILDLAGRITCEADDALGAGFDGRMEIVTSDGERATHAVAMSPTPESRIVTKFRTNLRHAPPAALAALELALSRDKADARTLTRLASAALSGTEAGSIGPARRPQCLRASTSITTAIAVSPAAQPWNSPRPPPRMTSSSISSMIERSPVAPCGWPQISEQP
jgi:2-methylcitrate dehydratase PrpD